MLRLRSDHDGAALRKPARTIRDAKQVRRLALAAIDEDESRSEAARIGGVTLQIVRDRVVRFNAEGSARLVDRKPPGCGPRLDATRRRALARIVEAGPIPAAHGIVRWRLIDLAQWAWDEFALQISEQTLSHALRALGYRKLSAPPCHHAQTADAIPAFKKTSPPGWRRSTRACHEAWP